MRLLELVRVRDTQVEVDLSLDFGDQLLGVGGGLRDTPGFIANRIGILWMVSQCALLSRTASPLKRLMRLSANLMGFRKTGIFGLLGLVGIDLQPHVERSMLSLLPENTCTEAFTVAASSLKR